MSELLLAAEAGEGMESNKWADCSFSFVFDNAVYLPEWQKVLDDIKNASWTKNYERLLRRKSRWMMWMLVTLALIISFVFKDCFHLCKQDGEERLAFIFFAHSFIRPLPSSGSYSPTIYNAMMLNGWRLMCLP
jgi:hypothetical protein